MDRNLGLVLVSLVSVLGCSEKTSLKNGPPTSPDAATGGSGGGGHTGASSDSPAVGGAVGGSTAGQGGTSADGGQGGVAGSTSTTTSGAGGVFGSGGVVGNGGVVGDGGVGGHTSGTTITVTTSVGGSSGGSSVGGTSSTGGSAVGGTATAGGGTTATGGTASGGGVAGTTAQGGTTTASGGSTTGSTHLGGTGGTLAGGQTGSTSPADDSPGQNPFARPAGSGILVTSSDGLNGIELLLAADTKDGMFVAGATRNPQAMGLTAFDPGVESEAFAARLDAQGKLVWSVPLKTCGVPADVAAGPDDSVFVLCPYEPDVTTLMPFTCDAAASVEKLSGADGKVLFEARVNVPATPADGYMCPYGLGVDAQGRSYVGAAYMPSAPTERAMLSAVTAAGQQDWTLISEGPASDPASNSASAYVTDVDVDSNGNVLFVGSFNTWMKLGATQLTSQAVVGQSSMYNGFFARVPTNGTGPTAWRFGGTVFDLATSLAPTGNGGFVMGGWASANSNIGGKAVSASQNGSAFVAQITSQGQATWAKVIPGDGITDGVAAGPDGKAYVVGLFASDEILYIYDPTADSLTSRKTMAGNATDNGLRTHSVAVSTSGAIWLSGTFQGTINLGTGALSTSTVASFLIKLN